MTRPHILPWLLLAACPAPPATGDTTTGTSSSSTPPASSSPTDDTIHTGTAGMPDAGVHASTGHTGSTGSTGGDDVSTADASSADASTGDPVDYPEAAWRPGSAPEVVPGPELSPLPGGLAGPPIWVSNNPEPFTGVGWLMQTARVDRERGGAPTPLTDGVIYAFHINHAGAARTLHVLATNPGPELATLAARGSLYNNSQEPLLGPASGPSFAVARDWELGALTTDLADLQVAPGHAVEIARSQLAANGMADGRFEFSASAGLYVYTVVSASGSLDDAINLSQGPGASGTIALPGPNAYGREAGVYAHSRWESVVQAQVPPPPTYLAVMLNTSDKFAFGGSTLQDQSAPALVHLSDSSERSHGNYGHRYTLDLSLCNAGDAARMVRIRFVSHKTGVVDEPSQTWNGPVRVDGAVLDVSTRPTAPSFTLGTWEIDPRGCRAVPVAFYVPGLITGGQQLVLESL